MHFVTHLNAPLSPQTPPTILTTAYSYVPSPTCRSPITHLDLHVALQLCLNPTWEPFPREESHCDEGATAQECVHIGEPCNVGLSQACVYTSGFVQSVCVSVYVCVCLSVSCVISLLRADTNFSYFHGFHLQPCRCGDTLMLYSGVSATQQMAG